MASTRSPGVSLDSTTMYSDGTAPPWRMKCGWLAAARSTAGNSMTRMMISTEDRRVGTEAGTLIFAISREQRTEDDHRTAPGRSFGDGHGGSALRSGNGRCSETNTFVTDLAVMTFSTRAAAHVRENTPARLQRV